MTHFLEETDLHRKQRYARELNALVARFDRLDNDTIRRLVALLQDLRKDIAATLLNNPSAYEQWRLTELQRSIEDNIQRFQSRAGDVLTAALLEAGQVGLEMVDKPLIAAGIVTNIVGLTPQIINIAADFSAMLIQDISDQLRHGIDAQLRLAALGQKSPFELMKAITNTMGVHAYDGVWGTRRRPDVVRGVAARAEAIVRTELTRTMNLAHQSRAEQAAKTVPGMKKRWMATGDRRTRPAHLEAHWATYNNPIPVDQPFEVDGEKLMQPGDPLGSAGNTINCRCRMVLVAPSIGVIQTPADILLEEERAKRENN